jgi:hypothetical protein
MMNLARDTRQVLLSHTNFYSRKDHDDEYLIHDNQKLIPLPRYALR